MKKSKPSQIKKRKPYPITDEHRRHYVRYAIQVTPKMVGIHLIRKEHVGKWVCVEVLKKGYAYVFAANPLDTQKECQKGCDIHNSYHGWSKKEVLDIISKSMRAK